MDIFSVKWTQVITVSGEWRQVSAPPARDFGDDFTAPTLNQAEKASLSVAKGDFGLCAAIFWMHPRPDASGV
jgi:hypothetical protein